MTGGLEYTIETAELTPGTQRVTVVDNSTGKATSKFLVVNAKDAAAVKVDVSPKTVIQGESTLLTGSRFSANETATVEITPVGEGAETVGAAMRLAAVEGLVLVKANQEIDSAGNFALRVSSADLALGDYQLIATDNLTGAADAVTFTVIAPEDNTAANTAANGADNTAANTAANGADNTAANTAANGADNTAANTAANGADNTAANTAANGADNTAANTAATGAYTTTVSSKKLASTGAESFGLVLGGGSLLLLGLVTMLAVRKRKSA